MADTWTNLADAPVGHSRELFAYATIGDYIYIAGGQETPGGTPTPVLDADRYNMLTGVWDITTIPDIPSARNGSSGVNWNGNFYVIGGDLLKEVLFLHVASNTWFNDTDLPAARRYVFAGVVNGKLIVAGGELAGGPGAQTTVWSLAVAGGVWQVEAVLPTARYAGQFAVINNVLYCIGGKAAGSALTVVEAFDGSSWSTKAAMPTGRAHGVAAVDGPMIYVINGEEAAGIQQDANEAYNSSNSTWAAKADALVSRQYVGAGSLNGAIYVVLGRLSGASNASRRVDRYQASDPLTDGWGIQA